MKNLYIHILSTFKIKNIYESVLYVFIAVVIDLYIK